MSFTLGITGPFTRAWGSLRSRDGLSAEFHFSGTPLALSQCEHQPGSPYQCLGLFSQHPCPACAGRYFLGCVSLPFGTL